MPSAVFRRGRPWRPRARWIGTKTPGASVSIPGGVATVTFSAQPPTTSVATQAAVATVTFDVRAAGTTTSTTTPIGGLTPLPDWRYGICARNGRVIALISRLALNKQTRYRLNRPATTSCAVPADDPLVNTAHTDGYPYVNEGNRTLKAWRRESGRWVIRYTGLILQCEDEGDEDRLQTLVSSFDPMQLLFRRAIRDEAGRKNVDVTFTSVSGATIAKQLVERTIGYAGPCGIAYSGSGATVTLDGTYATTTPQTITFPRGMSVGEALVALTDTATMDVIFKPVDRTDGALVEMSVAAARGVNKPAAIFAFASGNHSVQSVRRLRDAGELVNDVELYGQNMSIRSPQTDAASQVVYGVWEDVRILPDIAQQTFLDELAATELKLRKSPRETLSITPVAEKGPLLFQEYDVGDTVQVYVSSRLRRSFSGSQRVYGVDLDIDDDGYERVGQLIASANAE